MIGAVSVLMKAASIVTRIRRIAGTVHNVRNDFQAAGGGINGVVAGVKAVARAAFPGTADTAKAEIEQLKNTAVQELNTVIAGLRQELDDLKKKKQPVETIEIQLTAAIQCRENICTTAIKAICDIDVAKAEFEAEEEITAACETEAETGTKTKTAKGKAAPPQKGKTSAFMPVEKPVIPFIRQGIQEGFKHRELRLAGCYFFALYRWAEHVLGKPLGEENIVPLFNKCIKNGSVKKNAFINDPVTVLNTLCGSRRFTRVAVHTNDPEARYSGVTGVFVRRVMSGNFGAHFLLDINGYTWDSLGSNAHNYRPAGLRQIV